MNKILIFFFVLNILIPIDGVSQGLLFSSNEQLIDKRTSYNVFFENTPHFGSHFSIEFEISISDPKTFGYILSIGEKKKFIKYTLIYLENENSNSELRLNLEGKKNLLTIPLNKRQIGLRKWIKVILSFNSVSKEISLSIDDKKYKCKNNQFTNRFRPEIIFGKNNRLIDVPLFSIKNLLVNDRNRHYCFEFNESMGDFVHDSKGKRYGFVENPNWLINDSYHWRLRYESNFSDVTAISFNSKRQQFYIVSSDSLISYNYKERKFNSRAFKNRAPVSMRLGMSFIDDKNEYLYVYELNDVPNQGATFASIHLDSLIWNVNSNFQFLNQRHHHASFFDDKLFMIFGGFGNKKLTNSFNFFDLQKNEWKLLKFFGDTISPRFFAGMVQSYTQELLLFGGVGNETGEQSLGKKYYHDCYKIDLSEKKIKKLWVSKQKNDQVTARNLILSEDSLSFYSLCYKEYIPNTNLHLYKYNIGSGEYRSYGDSIPMISERIRTNANLYLDTQTNELFCTIQEFQLNGENRIKIYSINYPPVSINDINEYNAKINSKDNFLVILLSGGFIALIIFGWVIRKKGKQKKLEQEISTLNKYQSINLLTHKNENSINLFGNFSVTDKIGTDISHLFSPKISHLFLVILFHSIYNDPKGVTSEEIYSALWPDKDKQKAKNLKNVTINQLRKILIDVEGVEVVFENKLFSVRIDDNLFCDLLHFESCLGLIKNKEQIDQVIGKMLQIIKRGHFLKSIDLACFDGVKGNLETKIYSIIPLIISQSFAKNNFSQVISLSDILFRVDSISEIALYYKLHAFQKLGLTEDAKKLYNSYALEFNRIFKEDFSKTYREVSKRIPNNLNPLVTLNK